MLSSIEYISSFLERKLISIITLSSTFGIALMENDSEPILVDISGLRAKP